MWTQRKPKIVVLGGGTGMPILLRGLKNYPIDLSTIVTVADDGGSTGRLRKDIETPAPGDIRNVITALANVDEELLKLFQHRFSLKQENIEHAIGNIILVAMGSLTGSFYEAVQRISKLLRVQGNIYPIVNESVTLHAEMEDGTIVSGESKIPLNGKKIKRVFHTPNNIEPVPEAIEAIKEADLIVIAPGSLYTSILPNLIVSGISEAIHETKADVVYVCNIMTQNGETNDYCASDHVRAIYRHIGKDTIDSVIINTGKITDETLLCAYEKENSYVVTYDRQVLLDLGLDIIEDDLVDQSTNMIRHNTKRLAKLLYDMAQNNIVSRR